MQGSVENKAMAITGYRLKYHEDIPAAKDAPKEARENCVVRLTHSIIPPFSRFAGVTLSETGGIAPIQVTPSSMF